MTYNIEENCRKKSIFSNILKLILSDIKLVLLKSIKYLIKDEKTSLFTEDTNLPDIINTESDDDYHSFQNPHLLLFRTIILHNQRLNMWHNNLKKN
ncbi:gem-associated protein 5-like [Vespula squamosa]|uniref:Gem-associated protein 5-like n=1 Tax=Vespula squamosa TaxID=30214 RepID=A0ABD2B9J5_VESSQ